MRIEAVAAKAQTIPGQAVRRPASGGFQAALDAAVERSDVHVVGRGETLSEIVAVHLKASGRTASTSEIYENVERVARANGIRNADLIFEGARIDLSVLAAPGQASATHPDRSTVPGRATDAHAARPWSGILAAPARLTSSFGVRNDPLDGRRRHHHGIDLAAKRGTQIMPLMPGTVVFSGRSGAYGNAVVVRHANGVETLYGHNARNLVHAGDKVAANTPLGVVGSTGRSTGPHLHFEVRQDGHRVDPMAYVSLGAYAST